MQFTLVVLHVMCKIAHNNGGVVRPKQVEQKISSDEELKKMKISKYKIRQFFKECKDDGLLNFNGHSYVWRETHWLNYAGVDIINNMKLSSSGGAR